ncbi:karyopherin Kap95 [Cladochytrium replicatum]|nr:karyopherin Kap95 [Cladochytrium replicatum]
MSTAHLSLADVLANTLASDFRRQEAELKLQEFSLQSFPEFVRALAVELANDQNAQGIRVQASVQFKNCVLGEAGFGRKAAELRWLALPDQITVDIKNLLLRTLGSADEGVGRTAALSVAAVAEVEIPVDKWPGLIVQLSDWIVQAQPIDWTQNTRSLRLACLTTLGYINDGLERREERGLPIVGLPESETNAMINAIWHGARRDPQTDQPHDALVRQTAMTALLHSLAFIRPVFEKESNRHTLMELVCTATQDDESVKEVAFECLVKIVQLYYEYMELYMQQALINLTIAGMDPESNSESVVLQAIEFWSTVCEIEIADQDESDGVPRNYYSSMASEYLVQRLLHLLTYQDDADEDDDWNIHMAAGLCLGHLAVAVRDPIVQPVLSFVEMHESAQDWKYREAAVFAFGAILDGPSRRELIRVGEQFLPKLINKLTTDANVHIRDTTAWTLGQVCQHIPEAVESHLESLIGALLGGPATPRGLRDDARVGLNCAWCLMNLAEYFRKDPLEQTYRLSPMFGAIIEQLLQATDETKEADINRTANFRASVYEAISELIKSCAVDCIPVVVQLAQHILGRLNTSVEIRRNLLGTEEKMLHAEMQSNLCSVLTAVIRRLDDESQVTPEIGQSVMAVLYQVMDSATKESTVWEDVFLVISAIASALKEQFFPHYAMFERYLLTALEDFTSYQLCEIAVGVVGDVCRALNEGMLQFWPAIVTKLMAAIQSPELDRVVKPQILSCFGDVALAVGVNFQTALQPVMVMLEEATKAQYDRMSSVDIDWINTLREAILESYVGIAQGINNVALLEPFIPGIFEFLQVVALDDTKTDEVLKNAVWLMGDLANLFEPGYLRPFYEQEWASLLFIEAKSRVKDAMMRKYALAKIQKHCPNGFPMKLSD